MLLEIHPQGIRLGTSKTAWAHMELSMHSSRTPKLLPPLLGHQGQVSLAWAHMELTMLLEICRSTK